MTFWTVYTLILSVVASVISGIPLRASDLGQDGRIVHYHRDTNSGGHVRHIHRRPTVKRSHKTYRDTFFQKLGSAVNPSAVYEVPSNRHYNDAYAGRLAIQLRSLVEKTFGENNNTSDVKSDNSDSGDSNGKHENNYEVGIHSVQNRDAPTPPSEPHAHAHGHFPVQTLPHGLQFLNRQSQARRLLSPANSISDQSNGLTLDLNTLLGETVETTTPPSLTPSDAFMSTGSSLDLGFLLGGLGAQDIQTLGNQGHDHSHHVHSHQDNGHDHHVQSHSHSHGHGEHSHAHNSIHDKASDARSASRLGKPFMGLFNQHSSHTGHSSHVHQEEVTPPSTNTAPSRQIYLNSTQHSRPITKRGVIDSDSVPKTFIDNILNIRIMKTTPPPAVFPTTQPTRYDGYLTTSKSVETQIERLSGIDLKSVREKNRGLAINGDPTSNFAHQQITTMPEFAAPTQKELVHLQGIHVMFSDGRQDKTSSVPTVHLTAAVSENMNHLLRIAGGSPAPRESNNINQLTDKITGTAVIRDGHLYLVIYPFGHNKSLELHYNQTTRRLPLPHNNPVSFSDSIKPSARPNISSPKSAKTTLLKKAVSPTGRFKPVNPTAESAVSSTSYNDHHTSTGTDMTSTSHKHHHPSKPEVSTHTAMDKGSHQHLHHHHHHHHHPHQSSTPSLTGLKLAEVNDTTLQTLLAPIDRFVSPWKSLNFSKVFPYSAGKNKNKTSSKKMLDEDSEVDVVTFVAKATDPFNRMKDMIESLVNKTLSNVSSTPSPGNKSETRFNFELKLESGNVPNTNNNNQPTVNPNNSEEKTADTNINLTTLASKTTENVNTFEKVTEAMSTTTTSSFLMATQENSFTVGKSSGESIKPLKSAFDQLADDSKRYQTNGVNSPDVIKKDNTNSLNSENIENGITPPTVGNDVKGTLQRGTKNNLLLHVSEHIAPSTSGGRPRDFYGTKTTLSYIPNYTKSSFEKQPTYHVTTPSLQNIFSDNRNTIQRNVPAGSLRNTILGSNLQPFVRRTSPNRFRQGLPRGQSEQIISLSDILNDIRRIQLHNMQRFNIQNNNFDTMILSETKQKPVIRKPIVMEGPLIKETGNRRYSDFPAVLNNSNGDKNQQQQLNSATPDTTPIKQRRVDRHAVHGNAFEAMLVLSVDDIMSDQTDLHGAIVLSHRREASSSNTK